MLKTEGDPSGMRVLLKYYKDLILKNGLLYRMAQLKGHDQPVNQFVLPSSHCEQAVRACHDDFGYLGMEHTLNMLQGQVLLAQDE